MSYHTRLGDLTTRDLRRLHDAPERLHALFDAIQATSLQGKPAFHRLINEADDEIEALFRKGVVGLLNHIRRGHAPRAKGDPEFWQHVQQVAEAHAAVASGASGAEPATANQGTGEYGNAVEPAPAGDDSPSPA